MAKNIIGIDIGNYNIKYVEAQNNKGKMEIINYDIAKMPENAINDGKITDPEKVYVALGNLFRKNNTKTKKVAAVISSSALITREINVPKMRESELTKYIELDSQQHFPVNLEEYVLDYKVIEEVKGPDGPEFVVLLVAIPQMIINDYIKVFDRLKMDLLAIDIQTNVIAKYVEKHFAANKEKQDTFAVIDMGAKNTIVNIFEGKVLKFNRMIPHGGNDITRIIADTFNLDIPEGEEYKLKNAQLVSDGDNAEGLALNISETIKPVMDGLASSINKFFEFYHSRNNTVDIESIVLIGGGSLLKGFDNYLRSVFSIPVRKINITDGIIDRSQKPTMKNDIGFVLSAFAATYREID